LTHGVVMRDAGAAVSHNVVHFGSKTSYGHFCSHRITKMVATIQPHFLTSKYTKMLLRPELHPDPTEEFHSAPHSPDVRAGLGGQFLERGKSY